MSPTEQARGDRGMSVQLVKMTVYPDDDVNVDDQQYDDASSGSYSERGN